jgi:putative sterol carrier protein
MALHPELLENMSEPEFVALIKATPDQEIRDDFAGEHRGPLLDAIFARFPHQFRPDKAGDRTARIDFRVTGGPGETSDTYGVLVENGTCTVEKGAAESPDLSLMMGPAEFLKLITGTGNPAMMFMMGKVKARGDLGLASALSNWFESAKG